MPIAKSPAWRLYLFNGRDCGVCKAARPVLDKWALPHVAAGNLVIPLDVDSKTAKKLFEKHDFDPIGVPAYLLCVGDVGVVDATGGLNAKQLDRFLKEGLQRHTTSLAEADDEDEDDPGAGAEDEAE